jgi:hypothetical protein
MSTSLLPCPFCSAGETMVKPNTHWTGMRSEIISVEVRHWCEETTGVRGSHITMRAKTEDEAVAKWNRRASQPEGNVR